MGGGNFVNFCKEQHFILKIHHLATFCPPQKQKFCKKRPFMIKCKLNEQKSPSIAFVDTRDLLFV